jgi:hypothetical protein
LRAKKDGVFQKVGKPTLVLVLVGGSSVDLYTAKWQLCQFH